MRYFFLTFLFNVIVTTSMFSQLFVDINAGYSFPTLTQEYWFYNGASYVRNEITNTITYYSPTEHVKVNLGEGIICNGNIGYRFLDRLEFSINGRYLNNFKYKTIKSNNSTYQKTSVIYYDSDSIVNIQETEQKMYYYAKLYSIIPKVTYVYLFEKLSVSISLGMAYNSIEINHNQNVYGAHFSEINPLIQKWSISRHFKYYGANKFSFVSDIGVSYMILRNVEIYISSTFSRLRYKPEKGTQLYYNLNTDHYLDEYDQHVVNTEEGKVEPMNAPFDFSSIDVCFGLRYYLVKKKSD